MELNRKKSGLGQKFHDLTKQIVSECGYVLYDDEYIPGSSTLRVYIMDAETKTAVIEDCIKVDRAFNPHCETLEWIPDDFVLEVSSPGVYRSLKTVEHFETSIGEVILVGLSKDLDLAEGVKLPKSVTKSKKVRGELLEINENGIIINIEDQKVGIEFSKIKKASLDPDLHG